jgi:four helix bundle protein
MSALRSYRDLEVWRRSIDLVEAIYRASSAWPSDERFGLTGQVRRAAVSVPANVAEGAARQGTREFLQFLGVAKGSLAEVETHLILAERLEYLAAQKSETLLASAAEIGRMLSGLTKSLRSKS